MSQLRELELPSPEKNTEEGVKLLVSDSNLLPRTNE